MVLSLTDIRDKAEAVAQASPDEDVKDLAIAVREIANGLLRGGGARWPTEDVGVERK